MSHSIKCTCNNFLSIFRRTAPPICYLIDSSCMPSSLYTPLTSTYVNIDAFYKVYLCKHWWFLYTSTCVNIDGNYTCVNIDGFYNHRPV